MHCTRQVATARMMRRAGRLEAARGADDDSFGKRLPPPSRCEDAGLR